ncbi:MAG: hypothetical protein ACD_15C00137G0007 [uncultured bacterium]|nr:MAG: hypothetical protein ACD_15C00137G0007 [uncultured bacterium]
MGTLNKEFYERLSGRNLSDQEAFEARSNFVGFFDLLYSIDKRNEEKKKLRKTEKN